jgi:small-conductance mechanosensitive channel
MDRLLTDPTARKFVISIVGILLIVIFIRLLKKNLFNRIKSENWYKTRKMINALGYVFVIILLVVIFSDSLGGFAVTLGFAGAGITFALREVITSVAGWLGILGGGFYKTGDRVQLGGIKGDVIDIGILRTTVMELGEWVDADLYNGRIVRIANSFVFSEPVFNYSADFPFLWDEIKIPIRYGSDYELTKKILEKAANNIVGDYTKQAQVHWNKMVKKFMIENQSINSTVTVATTDNWIEYTLRYVVDFKKRRQIKSALFTEILKEIDNSKGTIEFASTTIEVKSNLKTDIY